MNSRNRGLWFEPLWRFLVERKRRQPFDVDLQTIEYKFLHARHLQQYHCMPIPFSKPSRCVYDPIFRPNRKWWWLPFYLNVALCVLIPRIMNELTEFSSGQQLRWFQFHRHLRLYPQKDRNWRFPRGWMSWKSVSCFWKLGRLVCGSSEPDVPGMDGLDSHKGGGGTDERLVHPKINF